MSENLKVIPSTSKGLRGRIRAGIIRARLQRQQTDQTKGVEGGSENNVLDQVIIVPEIMSLVLEKLDFRSLKQVRLVCKSWLREAQFHLEKRGAVRFDSKISGSRIQKFKQFREIYAASSLVPQASLSVEAYANELNENEPDQETKLSLISSLCPPLVLTRLNPWNIPLKLVLPLVIQCSSSLEYLKLLAYTCEVGYLPSLDPKVGFPNLIHLDVLASYFQTDGNNKNHFPSVAAWIVEASPNLVTYEYKRIEHEVITDLASEMLMKVDIKNVKTLILTSVTQPDSLSNAAMEHFLSIPFSQLQSLELRLYVGPPPLWRNTALFGTLAKSAHSLRKLDLTGIEHCDDFENFNHVLPNVHELTVTSTPHSNFFICFYFPALQVLNARSLGMVSEDEWEQVGTLPHLKTLRIESWDPPPHSFGWIEENEGSFACNFFERFPSIERLGVHPSFVISCCRLKASGNPKFSKLLESVKHLELCADPGRWVTDHSGDYYALLAALKGVETIALTRFNDAILTLPVGDLPCLRVLQFPWGDCTYIDIKEKMLRDDKGFVALVQKLLEMTKGIKKVVVTNCCSIPRVQSTRSKDLLEEFLESAPNAECGCEAWKKMPKWYADDDCDGEGSEYDHDSE